MEETSGGATEEGRSGYSGSDQNLWACLPDSMKPVQEPEPVLEETGRLGTKSTCGEMMSSSDSRQRDVIKYIRMMKNT